MRRWDPARQYDAPPQSVMKWQEGVPLQKEACYETYSRIDKCQRDVAGRMFVDTGCLGTGRWWKIDGESRFAQLVIAGF